LRLLHEFEADLQADSRNRQHHEQGPEQQKRFKSDIVNLLDVFNDEIIFSSTSADDLITLCSHTIAHKSVSETVKTAKQIGERQFQSFVDERLNGSLSVLSPLCRNKIPLFSFKPLSKSHSVQSLKMHELKTDCVLFSHLFIACQARDGDLDEFFRHENHPYPPSISNGGILHFGTKADLLACFDAMCDSGCDQNASSLTVDTYVLDGAAIVQMLKPGSCRTFQDYRDRLFVPYLLSLLKRCNRVDVVFDIYYADSLKVTTREKRGTTGYRIHVADNTELPANWQDFLCADQNKTELFHYLADACINNDLGNKIVLMTYDDQVRLLVGAVDTTALSPCSHEEADSRMILHGLQSSYSQHNAKTLAIRTVDTDVVVLALTFFRKLNLSQLWIHFGVGTHMRLIAVHDLSIKLGQAKCDVLPLFHAITGCDTVSAFQGKGKKSAWSTWNSYPALTQALCNLQTAGSVIQQRDVVVVERFVVIMYDRTSDCLTLDSTRKHLFTKKSRTLDLLPPTSDAFLQHVIRAVHQALCWLQSLEKQPTAYDPSHWGWTRQADRWTPLWMTLPQLSQSCRQLIHCSCKKGCTSRCKCAKANLACTALCQCDGECSGSQPHS